MSRAIERNNIPKKLKACFRSQIGCIYIMISPLMNYVNLCKVTWPFQIPVSSFENGDRNRTYLKEMLRNQMRIYPQPCAWYRVSAQNMNYSFARTIELHCHTLNPFAKVKKNSKCCMCLW